MTYRFQRSGLAAQYTPRQCICPRRGQGVPSPSGR